MTIVASQPTLQSTHRPSQQHWQLAGEAGGIISGFDDVSRCVEIILNTRLHTDVLRPLFGSNHQDYIDSPQDVFIPNAVREVVVALSIWEPRIVVDKVTFNGAAPHITMTVFWYLVGDVAKTIAQSEVSIYV